MQAQLPQDHDNYVLKVKTVHTLPLSLLHTHCLGLEWVAGSTSCYLEWGTGSQWTSKDVEAPGRVTINSFGLSILSGLQGLERLVRVGVGGSINF